MQSIPFPYSPSLSLKICTCRAAAKAIGTILSEWHAALEGAHRCCREAEDALSKAQLGLGHAMEKRDTIHLRHVPLPEGYFGERPEGDGSGRDNVWFHVPATMTGGHHEGVSFFFRCLPVLLQMLAAGTDMIITI